MPFVQKRLINPTTLTTSASSALYTVPAGFSTVIKQLVVTNTTGSAATFTFYIGDAVAGNALFSATSVAANDTVIINLSQVLQSNEVLRALASANSTLNLTVSGVENDGPLEPSANFIANDSVTVNKIADGSVTSAKIADGTIVANDLASNAITTEKIADNAITSVKILDGTIVDGDINASAAIAQTKVANLSTSWNTWVPVVTQGATISLGAGYLAKWKQIGKTVFVQFRASTTSAGTSANPLLISLPVAPINNAAMGILSISGSGTNTYVIGAAIWWSSGAANQFGQLSASGNWWGISPSTALASGEALYASLVYEVA
jgi:hypothetical protein